MTAQLFASRVLIHATLVGEEVSVDGEGALNWTVGHYLGHELGLVVGNRVGALAKVLVIRVGCVVARDALLFAFRCRLLALTRRQCAVDVVVARRYRVRLAALVAVVVAASDLFDEREKYEKLKLESSYLIFAMCLD